MPAVWDEAVRGFAGDRTSGALELTLRAIDLMAGAADRSEKEVDALAHSLAAAQPAMAGVRNAAQFCAKALKDSRRGGVSYTATVSQFRRYVETSRPRAGRQLLKVVPGEVSVLTLSYSSTVIAALELLHGRHQVITVTVLESLPGGEGKSTADRVQEMGMAVKTAPDSRRDEAVEGCDLVLLGADAILRDGGIVNKVGSLELARAARAAGKRLYVCAETIKLDLSADSTLQLPPGSWFEVVPPELVAGIATERGVLTAELVRNLAATS